MTILIGEENRSYLQRMQKVVSEEGHDVIPARLIIEANQAMIPSVDIDLVIIGNLGPGTEAFCQEITISGYRLITRDCDVQGGILVPREATKDEFLAEVRKALNQA
ncbi:MAG: hypothetical protein A3C49_01280 [Candidatus Doudnabacteria bacterium RIFCSPHIGHO2_02_FULL_42_25]|uniref:Response regulatory domain-containing protein n=1 Tax=Candidatus Doudnabacteria bacterium RIFCSPHIGHO2_01_FULL_41_86 TaxID=1817821 RepID=A0A1F5N8Y0_9BACT|nr:MAG: hypothetical protein A2717_00725 [Candidatus Doudnabacteria bacterium RIFCSPHIGHO2_01_FULL_41_86]OGE75368.1 MAG: hypothetical protein A3K07_01240 [Candidatus Doudnabacteria bacterium RIFCSPHIGHO2_01_43_10]OGE86526.1 MAG: hypothetical protein A3E28_04695 [Candidatus Doudnabacteria bacterium RIFCSPHIGHO2_12_FULL_42_22]OGE87449.1 MAG: hypothetical protein A3C49_01280 [Candidatus Doudnabacteria bacterium RIFCSPHIGHO2_02_FULL_42_25]OGE92761.1 MAG: hypothetical protein A2895_04530 [Candidatus